MAAQYKINLLSLTPQHIQYPAVLRNFLGEKAPETLTAIGNLDILKNKKLALFCSKKCPGEIIIATYDLMKNLRDTGVTVVSGFHSPVERECLNILMRSNQPIIICPARSIEGVRLRKEYKKLLENGQLLLLSPFTNKERRMSAGNAVERNRFVAALADATLVVYAALHSKTEELCKLVLGWGKPLYTLKSEHNANLVELGVKLVTLGNISELF